MPMPTADKMEDLSGLEKLFPGMALHLTLGRADRGFGRHTSLYRRIYIRLVDKALDEYLLSKKCIGDQIHEGERSAEHMNKTGRYIYMFKFIDHMENCILTVRRILRLLEALKSDADRAAIGLDLPRTKRKQIEALDKSIVGVRNVVEHIDEQIRKDGIESNQLAMLGSSENQDGVVIGDQYLRFADLSNLIKQMHELGRFMAAWRDR
jgi:hypothetical protein